MRRYTSILHPTDFSTCSARALDLALRMAARHDAALHVLHVATFVESDALSPLRYTGASEASLERIISEMLESYARRAGVRSTRIVTGWLRGGLSVASKVREYARREGVDLVVVGLHGRAGIRRLLRGSVAEEILRAAPCDVLSIRVNDDRPAEAGPFRRVLVPVDFSACSAQALVHAREIAAGEAAHLDVLHVIDRARTAAAASHAALASGVRAEEDVRLKLERFVDAWGGPGPDAALHVEQGRPWFGITGFAALTATDLVVLGACGRSHPGSRALGRIAARVARTSPCPVLVVRPQPEPEVEAGVAAAGGHAVT